MNTNAESHESTKILTLTIFINISGFTVQSVIIYGVNLFTMPGMHHVNYVLVQVFAATSY